MRRSLLRNREEGSEERVGFIELFFDLVFVFAVTQVSHSLIEHADFVGYVQAAMLLLAVWWVWVDTTWVTNWLDVQRSLVRILMFALMAGAMLMAIGISGAFGDRGLLFAIAYLVSQFGRTIFMIFALRRHSPENHLNFLRILCWYLAEAPFWILGALAQEPGTRMAWWAAALVLASSGPLLAFWTPGLGRTDTRTWDVEGHHFSERCGLFIIIALGESILVTGGSFAGTSWSPATVAAFASAFIGTIAMWWIYFDTGAQRAATHLKEHRDPGKVARAAYTYLHLPIVAGIIVIAAADELVLQHPTGPAAIAAIATIVGGPALYLFGNMLFKRTSAGRLPLSHMIGLALLAGLAAMGWLLEPVWISVLATSILVLVAVWELVSLRETRRELHD